MKKFELDLSNYDVTAMVPDVKDGKHEMVEKTNPYPLRENLSGWLRSLGIFRSAEDIAEAVSLAKEIRECEDDIIQLDERQAEVLKKAVNRLVELTADGQANLGGEVHEEAIIRVVRMKEVK